MTFVVPALHLGCRNGIMVEHKKRFLNCVFCNGTFTENGIFNHQCRKKKSLRQKCADKKLKNKKNKFPAKIA